jgi:CBS domain-containing protein
MLRDVCTKPVVTVTAETPISEAARLMHERNIGTVVVANGNRPRGILTDRDIAIAVAAEGRRPSTHVGDVMHPNPAVIREDKGIFDAVKTLAEHRVRRLPVVDGEGQLTGIIALDDVLMLLGNEMGQVASALSRELGRTPEVVLR